MLKHNALVNVLGIIGEWKYVLINDGTKEEFDKYINEKFGAVWLEADRLAKGELAYCLTRISGHMTDEMDAMTPEELERRTRVNAPRQ